MGALAARHEGVRQRSDLMLRIGSLALAIVGVAILSFGFVMTLRPSFGDPLYVRTIGVASLGMGLFGVLITVMAYRRRERWAWFTLWYYPVFWLVHLIGGLPPGKEHLHQLVFIGLSIVGLLLPLREFFPRR
jgi:hypothetical protein